MDTARTPRGRFGKGNTGKPKGAKNVIPGTFKTTLMGIYQKLQQERPELFEQAITKGLELDAPQNFAYVKMWAEYSEGKPVERVELTGKDGGPVVYAWED